MDVTDWLLDSDPAIRWQVLRDLLDAPPREWEAERARVETTGWGAELLAQQDADGRWAGGTFAPGGYDWSERETHGQSWQATAFVLSELRELGLPPGSASARSTVERIARSARWEHDDQPFWDGEVEECINGRLVADGAYLGVDVDPVVERLVDDRLEDGGWNCYRLETGSMRSSFDSTLNVLEGLLEHQRATGGTDASRAARAAGEEYLLRRSLFRRLSTGEPADPDYLRLVHPNRYCYDVLRALDHFRAASLDAGTAPDDRLGEAVEHVRSRRQDDGRWLLERDLPGPRWLELDDGVGRPSRWLTLRALRVLRWWDAHQDATEPPPVG